ncbi:helix-turn-helix domain-containing protein [Lacisediminimonas profundi]|uniref:helix-turn-helix domain-containing protein n=1 Tax=Lacisediminimonas profundi TaxID=2603856 RepID=UPI00124B33C4|nr:helix-turn-helix transcriptional regulator [Lacisediminimonas profundi]
MATLRDIGSKIKTARQRQQLTLLALAEKSHVHRNTLSALEQGVGNVELNTLLALCEQLGLDVVLVPRHTTSYLEPAGESAQLTGLQKRLASRLAAAGAGQGASSTPLMVMDEPASTTGLQRRIAGRLARAKTAK